MGIGTETNFSFFQINEPGANAGTKHRVNLPPGYRQFREDYKEIQIFDKTREQNQQNNDEKTKEKFGKIRTLLKNYFMSRRRFYKLIESKMDR